MALAFRMAQAREALASHMAQALAQVLQALVQAQALVQLSCIHKALAPLAQRFSLKSSSHMDQVQVQVPVSALALVRALAQVQAPLSQAQVVEIV